MNEQPFNADHSADHSADRGSAWAALDETFFAIVDGLFSAGFRALADSMLGTHDNDLPPAITPEAVEIVEAEAAERRAAMRRHPSAWRRF